VIPRRAALKPNNANPKTHEVHSKRAGREKREQERC
jgi:hypothetical protein